MDITPDARIMLLSLLAMGALHLFMLIWLYATRIPAFLIYKIRSQTATKATLEGLPKWATNPANNYNNLAEAPTTFYGVTLALVLLGQADALDAQLCLAYVAIRTGHSLFQGLINIILIRFLIFTASWVVLGVLIVRGLVSALGLV